MQSIKINLFILRLTLKNMYKTVFVFWLFFIICLLRTSFASAQNEKFELSLQTETIRGEFDYGKKSINNLSFSTGLNYYVTEWIDFGTSFGWLGATHYPFVDSDNMFMCHALTLELNSRIHIMPIFVNTPLRFDLYVSPKIMSVSKYFPSNSTQNEWSKPYLNYGIGLGLKYMISKKIGTFVEMSTGKFFPNENKRLKLGFTLKL